MHASRILLQSLSDVLLPMHARRRRVLLAAVEALIAGRRLTLTDLARAWPRATFMHAPLKALDRLLSNARVQQVIPDLHRGIARWALRGPHPVIVVGLVRPQAGWSLVLAAGVGADGWAYADSARDDLSGLQAQ